MSWLGNLLKGFEYFFESPKVEAVEKDIELLIPQALTLVQALALAVPNKTVDELAKAYALYAVPASEALTSGTVDFATELENLATQILARQVPSAGVTVLKAVLNLVESVKK